MNPSIRFEDVHYRVDDVLVLDNVTVTLRERRIGIVGTNGSGKSTLARMVNGLVLPTRGRVSVDDLDTARDGPAVRRRVGFLFTNPDAQIVMPTVAEDVAFSLRRLRLSPAERDDQVATQLARFGLTDLADRPAQQLSGGQKQLLALAAVLVMAPDILVADEPTTLLDARNARRFGELLEGLDAQVILVSHHLDLLAGADRVLVLDAGRIAADDTPAAALPHYRRLVS